MRSPATSIRRSLATGCWRASSSNERISTRSRAASMTASSEMTFSAISASAVSSAWVARATASCTSWVIVTSSSTIDSSWSK